MAGHPDFEENRLRLPDVTQTPEVMTIIATPDNVPELAFRDAWVHDEDEDENTVVVIDYIRMKPIAIKQVYIWRETENEKDIYVEEHWYNCDTNTKARENILGATQMAIIDILEQTNRFNIAWHTADDILIYFDSTAMLTLGKSLGHRTSLIYNRASQIVDMIQEATDELQIRAALYQLDADYGNPYLPEEQFLLPDDPVPEAPPPPPGPPSPPVWIEPQEGGNRLPLSPFPAPAPSPPPLVPPPPPAAFPPPPPGTVIVVNPDPGTPPPGTVQLPPPPP